MHFHPASLLPLPTGTGDLLAPSSTAPSAAPSSRATYDPERRIRYEILLRTCATWGTPREERGDIAAFLGYIMSCEISRRSPVGCPSSAAGIMRSSRSAEVEIALAGKFGPWRRLWRERNILPPSDPKKEVLSRRDILSRRPSNSSHRGSRSPRERNANIGKRNPARNTRSLCRS